VHGCRPTLVKLPFQVSEFVAARERGVVPVTGGAAFGTLAGEPRRLEAQGGPAVVVDLDDVVILWYFPNFLGSGLQVWVH
jgi:hypothetical protein